MRRLRITDKKTKDVKEFKCGVCHIADMRNKKIKTCIM